MDSLTIDGKWRLILRKLTINYINILKKQILETQQNTLVDDYYFLSKKNKTLKEYDEQIKQLQDENINLKLRIYLLEEKSKSSPSNNDYNLAFMTISNEQIELLTEKVSQFKSYKF